MVRKSARPLAMAGSEMAATPGARATSSSAYSMSGVPHPSLFAAEENEEEDKEADDDESDESIGYALFDGPTTPINSSAQYRSPIRFLKSTPDSESEDETAADSESEDEAAAADDDNFLESIIAQQSFEGSWVSISDLLQKKMGINLEDYRKAVDDFVLDQHSLDRGKAEVSLDTAIVVVYLKQKLPKEEETWELIVEKAKSWLEDNLDEGMLKAVWAAATGLVQA